MSCMAVAGRETFAAVAVAGAVAAGDVDRRAHARMTLQSGACAVKLKFSTTFENHTMPRDATSQGSLAMRT